ncbi:ATP-dependent RNA helicase dbp2 [Plakobranchus ocellatus]|uniref:ATP-dependent RNA helicase dbp2 n=1 Tax=Plakobranchus ocellatus TaxID=259542 RepID=A0AAV4BJV3_9GAST|nr:ATP-dependent RNA helicase dbp2 [Plakobranchus ocellatus]
MVKNPRISSLCGPVNRVKGSLGHSAPSGLATKLAPANSRERKLEGYSLALSQEMEKLKQKWNNFGGLHHHSEVADILAPYVEEYWRLDNLSKGLLDSDKKQLLKTGLKDSPKAIVSAMMDARTISRCARHSKLLWLSQIYPQELLDYLLQGISFENDTVDQNQLRQWQSLIGLDGGDLLNFEFVCRLMFHIEPAKLLPFVKCAESVSEQAVGVSAFVRKKHSLIYYKTSCECLPECQTSTNPKVAATSKARLIQASQGDNCEEKALKCYLQHGLWMQAIELLKDIEMLENPLNGSKTTKQRERQDLLPTLLHVTVTALAEVLD